VCIGSSPEIQAMQRVGVFMSKVLDRFQLQLLSRILIFSLPAVISGTVVAATTTTQVYADAIHSYSGKKLKVTTLSKRTTPPGLKRQTVDNGLAVGPDGPRAVYYRESQCNNGYDCVIRLGNSFSSPKIIVVGKKRSIDNMRPKIIYPPS